MYTPTHQRHVCHTQPVCPEQMQLCLTRLGVPLQIGRGGLREGVVLEMMAAARKAA